MNLKIRLALLYSLSVFIILLASALSIYILNENFRKEEFFKRLILKATEIHTLFYRRESRIENVIEELNDGFHYALPQENVILFDSAYNILFKSSDSPFPTPSKKLFHVAKNLGEWTFTINDHEAVLLYKNQRGRESYVLASATDVFGHRKSYNLKVTLTLSVLGGILLSGFLAFFYVKQAMKPLEELKGQIENINEENLKQRINVGKSNNEVKQIATKFNAMLDRLEQSFEQRKNFVRHASHELRTPLSNMLAQTESALSKELSAHDYRNILYSLKEEQQDLINLTNSLLALSKYEKITKPNDWLPVRLDELLYDTVDTVKQLWPEAIVDIDFEEMPESEDNLIFEGSESLLKSALLNVVKNGLQYSENLQLKTIIRANSTAIVLHFRNTGKQLSAEEQSHLFIPFFRGENAQNKKGYGLGLSIVQRIMKVHKGTISYKAMTGNVNQFTIFLPHT